MASLQGGLDNEQLEIGCGQGWQMFFEGSGIRTKVSVSLIESSFRGRSFNLCTDVWCAAMKIGMRMSLKITSVSFTTFSGTRISVIRRSC